MGWICALLFVIVTLIQDYTDLYCFNLDVLKISCADKMPCSAPGTCTQPMTSSHTHTHIENCSMDTQSNFEEHSPNIVNQNMLADRGGRDIGHKLWARGDKLNRIAPFADDFSRSITLQFLRHGTET